MIYRDTGEHDQAGRLMVRTFMFSGEGRKLEDELRKLGIEMQTIEKVPCG